MTLRLCWTIDRTVESWQTDFEEAAARAEDLPAECSEPSAARGEVYQSPEWEEAQAEVSEIERRLQLCQDRIKQLHAGLAECIQRF